MNFIIVSFIISFFFNPYFVICAQTNLYRTDILVYGATPAGVLSAVASARHNASVLLFNPDARIGGMMSSGLSFTDVGDANCISGLALEFFIRNAKHYNSSTASPDFLLEPHIAESLFEDMLREQSQFLSIINSPGAIISEVQRDGNNRINQVSFSDGSIVQALAFIDASYQGDLIAASNITFTVGREGVDKYNESLAGVTKGNSFPIDPRVSNSSGSDLLPGVTGRHAGELGSADSKVQAYTFRLCLTRETNNMIPFVQPSNYNASDFELLRRYATRLSKPKLEDFLSLQPLHNNKFDCNNGGFVSMDMIGGSWNYPLGNQSERNSAWNAHFYYCSGLLWTLQNDETVPKVIRDDMKTLGLCADEFKSTNGWPEMLYVREARRMIGDFVFLQSDIDNRPSYGMDSVALGSYTWDAHAAQRVPCLVNYSQHPAECVTVVDEESLDLILENGLGDVAVHVMEEGDPGARPEDDYEIPLQVLFPKSMDATNLLSPVCPSASHVAFSSLRTEPTLMALGHAAGDAAALFVQGGYKAIQDIDAAILHHWLLTEGAKTTHS